VKDAAPSLGTSLSLAASYVAVTSARAAAAAEAAAQRKEIKQAEIAQTHLFYPLAFEIVGPINVVVLELISNLGPSNISSH